ncbi:hypothetical protein CEXT_663191 [Caerostris extrusa]|uniref:Uncharacterized protein n=1 Tax=Caerostris extrusa TaxID=172846 RepID=A0AAV4QVD3_CAEEX|nr:hypothetical protein CEXT_663191 [Caerostris extrusa]
MNDLLQTAKAIPFTSTIEMKACYHQVKLHSIDQDKRVFVRPFDQNRFKRMSFEFWNVPVTFQRFLDNSKGIETDPEIFASQSIPPLKVLKKSSPIFKLVPSFVPHLECAYKILTKFHDPSLIAPKRNLCEIGGFTNRWHSIKNMSYNSLRAETI